MFAGSIPQISHGPWETRQVLGASCGRCLTEQRAPAGVPSCLWHVMGKQKTYQPFYRDLIRTIWGSFILFYWRFNRGIELIKTDIFYGIWYKIWGNKGYSKQSGIVSAKSGVFRRKTICDIPKSLASSEAPAVRMGLPYVVKGFKKVQAGPASL